MIYTSYFANLMKLDKSKYLPIGITRFPPNWFRGHNIEMVAPSKELLFKLKNKEIDEDTYKIRYLNDLESKKEQIINYFNMLNRPYEKDIVLCCYEKSEDFCHRHILSDWLNNNILNINIKELI